MADEIRCSVELRQSDDSPGRLVGTLLTFGERAADRPETFEKGSLSWPRGGVWLRRQHVRAAPIMRVEPIASADGNSLIVDVPLPNTTAGRDAAVEVRSGTLPGLSVEFRATAQRYVGGVRRISKALLTGAGLVDDPSYAGSRAEVRQRQGRRRLWL